MCPHLVCQTRQCVAIKAPGPIHVPNHHLIADCDRLHPLPPPSIMRRPLWWKQSSSHVLPGARALTSPQPKSSHAPIEAVDQEREREGTTCWG
ncbi:unnamed protein product [Musa hybrid cultivar]